MLALLVRRRPNLLLLDEPTNHLDIDMRQALANALQEYSGALILVSHDRHLLRLTTDRLLLVDQGRCEVYDDSLDSYPAWLARRQTSFSTGGSRPSDGAPPATSRKERKRAEAERRQALLPLRRALQQAENTLETIETERKAVEQSLADPTLYEAANQHELKRLMRFKAELDTNHATAENAWLEAADALEQAEQSA